jgi:hypothetical protein
MCFNPGIPPGNTAGFAVDSHLFSGKHVHGNPAMPAAVLFKPFKTAAFRAAVEYIGDHDTFNNLDLLYNGSAILHWFLFINEI